MRRYEEGAYLINGLELLSEEEFHAKQTGSWTKEDFRKAGRGSIAYAVLMAHNQTTDEMHMKLKADMLISDDPTYVSILQTAKASGLQEFPVPYVLSNCHNSLHAAGGTINCDDHVFGLSAARKYGGIYIPPHVAVMHQYMRETAACGGAFALGSDSHTRYGALGTMSVGEGGGEVVKHLLGGTYDVTMPEIVAVYLEGKPGPGIGPQDVALALIREVYPTNFVKNRILEFVGPGIKSLSADFRNGVEVMTAETACFTSIWMTDEETRKYLRIHGREEDYKELRPSNVSWYDKAIRVDLSKIHSMIALPFHPSHAYEIREFQENASDLLYEVEQKAQELCGERGKGLRLTEKLKDGKLQVDQAVIAGCAGGLFSNIMAAAVILKNGSWNPAGLSFSVYPASQPILMELMNNGTAAELMRKGVILKTAFCGPCIGAGDVPANGDLSIRHVTRNFLNREGAKAKEGQIAAVALMDARSIAATAANGGRLTAAEDVAGEWEEPEYHYDASIYKRQIQNYYGRRREKEELVYGPNIKDWPEMKPVKNRLLLKVCAKLMDEVTTTDDLSPSGEAAAYRANPLRLAEYTLSAREPEYVGRAKKIQEIRQKVEKGQIPEELLPILKELTARQREPVSEIKETEMPGIGSVIYAKYPGDGSSREQAASSQRVLGGLANICLEYATKRYRTNLINWGMLPLQMEGAAAFEVGDWIYLSEVEKLLSDRGGRIRAWVIGKRIKEISLFMLPVTEEEREIIRAGSLINYNRMKQEKGQ